MRTKCECGADVCFESLRQHRRTARHKRWMNWDEYVEQKQQHLKEYYASDAYRALTAKRTETDRENGWQRQKDYKKQLETCECGCTLSKGEMYRHVKSRRHLRKMEEKGVTDEVPV